MNNKKWNNWLKEKISNDEKQKISEFGNLLGLNYSNDNFYGSNFERGLLLRQIIRDKKPRNILELGTGRGFATICMAECIKSEGMNCLLETIDCIPFKKKQVWPYFKNGNFYREEIALDYFWGKEFPNIQDVITLHYGKTSKIIKIMLDNSKTFDFVFMDAAHDLSSVFLDLIGAMAVLSKGGSILLDDFAPMESFGTATCIAVKHAAKFFESMEIIETEGSVYISDKVFGTKRSMVFLENKKDLKFEFNPSTTRVLLLRVVGRILDWLHSSQSFKV
jgi:predicted O-methyltransferase YrrM